MHHARSENVQIHWTTAPTMSAVLLEAAAFAKQHENEGYMNIHTHLDYESGGYELTIYLYS